MTLFKLLFVYCIIFSEESAQENVHNRLLTAVLETKPLPVHGSMETVKNECVEVRDTALPDGL